MPDDFKPVDPPEWFKAPAGPQPSPRSPGDLRWPSASPHEPAEHERQPARHDTTRVPVGVRLPSAPPPSTSTYGVVAPPAVFPERVSHGNTPDAGLGGSGWRVRHFETATERPWNEAVPPPTFQTPLPTAMPWEQATRPRTPPRRLAALGVALFALFGLAALAISDFSHTTHSISQPSSVGALTQLTDPRLDAAIQTVQRAVLTAGAANVVDGVYGTDGRAQLVLIVVQGPNGQTGGTPSGLQGFFNGLASGAGASGWTLDRSHATLTKVDGTAFECSPVSAPALQGNALSTCAWNDGSAAGVVFDVTGQPMADTLNQAVQARSASEG